MDAADPLRARLAAAWPVFGLEIRSERLRLRLPTDDELLELMALAQDGIHPPESMPFATAWSTMPSPGFERNYLEYHWGNRATWTPESWELGLGIFTDDGEVIGMQGVHARRFAELRTVDTGDALQAELLADGTFSARVRPVARLIEARANASSSRRPSSRSRAIAPSTRSA